MMIASNPTRLLLIEDDQLSREFLTIQITSLGLQLATAASGDDALEQLAQSAQPLPDAILADLQMPGTCGPELAQCLRSLALSAGRPNLVLVAMSASPPSAETISGYDGFLRKPFTMGQLMMAIHPSANPQSDEPSNSSGGSTAAESLDPGTHQSLMAAIPADQLKQLYDLFLKDVEDRIERMRHASEGGDDLTYRREAHAIKGASSMVGATELQILAAAGEQCGIDSANHVASLSELLIACSRLRRILVAHQTGATS